MTNNIRALRKAAGMTMKQLGNLMGVSESTISLYENGKAEPDIAMLRKIADCFGVTIDYLLTDNPFIPVVFTSFFVLRVKFCVKSCQKQLVSRCFQLPDCRRVCLRRDDLQALNRVFQRIDKLSR